MNNELQGARIRLEGALETVEAEIAELIERSKRLDADLAPGSETLAQQAVAEEAVRKLVATEPALTAVLSKLDQAREAFAHAVWRRLWALGHQRLPTADALRLIADEPIRASARMKQSSWGALVSGGTDRRCILTSKRLFIHTKRIALSEIKTVAWSRSKWGTLVVHDRRGSSFTVRLIEIPRGFFQALRSAYITVVEK